MLLGYKHIPFVSMRKEQKKTTATIRQEARLGGNEGAAVVVGETSNGDEDNVDDVPDTKSTG